MLSRMESYICNFFKFFIYILTKIHLLDSTKKYKNIRLQVTNCVGYYSAGKSSRSLIYTASLLLALCWILILLGLVIWIIFFISFLLALLIICFFAFLIIIIVIFYSFTSEVQHRSWDNTLP